MMMMNIKQKKIKIELRIKLNYNIYNEQDIYTNMALAVQSVGNFIQCIPNQWIVLFTHSDWLLKLRIVFAIHLSALFWILHKSFSSFLRKQELFGAGNPLVW